MSIASELFEKLVLNTLRLIIENNELIADYQFVFRQKHSTIDQMRTITESIVYWKKNNYVFLDVPLTAFNTVWQECLLQKLRKMLLK